MERDMVAERGKCVLSVSLSSLFAGNTTLLVQSEPFKHFTALKEVPYSITFSFRTFSLII